MEHKIIFATSNEGKMREVREILKGLKAEVLSMKEAGVSVDIVEDGDTFEANAKIKARAVWEKTGGIVLADDSGLAVDYLNGEPGVYSARYGGPELDDIQRYQLLLQALRGQTNRAAHFTSHITCCFPNGDVIDAEGICPGTIAFAPQGDGGFGYDPVFFVPQLRKTYAQLTPEEKAAVSHRGKALAVFEEKLKEYLAGQR